jgi:hypothetical protein
MTTKQDLEWDALLAAQDDGEGEVVPLTQTGSYLQGGEILSDGTGEVSGLMRISDLRYKGYRPVWDTQTGVESLQPRYLLWQTMRKQHADGTQAFTLTNPHIAQDHGADLFCFLNPASPDHEMVANMGFKPCKKAHIPTVDAQLSHLSHTHKRAFAAIERLRQERIREEDRKLQRDAIEAQTALITAMAQNQSGVPITTEPGKVKHNHRAPYNRIVEGCPSCDLKR